MGITDQKRKRSTKTCFLVPMNSSVGITDQNSIICRNALQGILDIGWKQWKTSVKNLMGLCHGSIGRTGPESNRGHAFGDVYLSLHIFFKLLIKEEGTPFATQIIRDKTGMITRDDNPDGVALPPHMSKHRCYSQWCWSRGWVPTKSSRSQTIYDKVVLFNPRPHDAYSEVPLWPTGSVGEGSAAGRCFTFVGRTIIHISECEREVQTHAQIA